MSVGKKLSVGKKMSVGEFPPPKWQWKCADIPWNARPKNGRGVKKTPRAYRGGEKKSSPCGEKKNSRLGEKMSVGIVFVG